METFKKMAIGLALIGLLAGCAHEGSDSSSSGGGTTTTPTTPTTTSGNGTGTDPATTGYASGSTVELTNTDSANALVNALDAVFFKSNPSSPTNVRINIDITRIGSEVIVSYYQNGTLHQNSWSTVHPYSGINNNSLNGWILQNGKWVWKGFFQDGDGALVIVIDRALSTGDGQPGNIIGGTVYYQNFNRNYPSFWNQGSQSMCWQIWAGPYDCRSFIDSSVDPSKNSNRGVVMTSADKPTTKGPNAVMYYTKLGEFYGIDRAASGLTVDN